MQVFQASPQFHVTGKSRDLQTPVPVTDFCFPSKVLSKSSARAAFPYLIRLLHPEVFFSCTQLLCSFFRLFGAAQTVSTLPHCRVLLRAALVSYDAAAAATAPLTRRKELLGPQPSQPLRREGRLAAPRSPRARACPSRPSLSLPTCFSVSAVGGSRDAPIAAGRAFPSLRFALVAARRWLFGASCGPAWVEPPRRWLCCSLFPHRPNGSLNGPPARRTPLRSLSRIKQAGR